MSISADVAAIYDMLLSGEEVTIQAKDFKQAENLRVYLSKKHREFVAVEIATGSLLFDWIPETCQAKYKLGTPRRHSSVTFEIVSHVKLPVSLPETVESDQIKHGASESSLSEEASGDSDSSSSEVQEPTEYSEESPGSPSFWATQGRAL